MINWDRVSELRDEVGDESFAEVVTLFLDEVDEVLARLRAAETTESYRADLHFLKGSALNLGFRGLGALCHDGQMPASADAGGRTLHLAKLLSTYDRSKAEFLATTLA